MQGQRTSGSLRGSGVDISSAINPDILLKMCDLALKLGRAEQAQGLLASAAIRLEDWSSHQLLQLLRIAEKVSDNKMAALALSEAAERDHVPLVLANYVLKLSHTSNDRSLVFPIRDWLETRVPGNVASRFRLQSDLLLLGPEVALENARTGQQKRRDPNEAADFAELLLQAGKRALSLRYLAFCRRRWPHSFRFVGLLVSAYSKFGYPQNALDLLAEIGDQFISEQTLRLRANVLLEIGRLEEVERLIESTSEIGASLFNPLQMLRLLIGRGEIVAAESLARVVSSGTGRDGSAISKFRVTHIGAMLNEAQLFSRAAAESVARGEGATFPELERAYFYPAKLALDRWQHATPIERHVSSDGAVPRRIIQYWNTEAIPAEVESVMESWQNLPGYTYHLFDQRKAKAFLKDRFDSSHLRAFLLANHVAEECDFLRLCLLLAKGGIYADADDMRVGDPERLRCLGSGAILFREAVIGAVANNVMIAQPGHRLFQIAVDMARDSLLGRENDSTWSKTGPGLITRATAAYIAETPPDEAAWGLALLPQYILKRQVNIHVRLPYKTTPAYWNSKDGTTPPELNSVLQRLVHSAPVEGGSPMTRT